MITKHVISTHGTPNRGDLSVMDLPSPEWKGVRTCPFEPRRIFWITRMEQLARRGGHAHKAGQQFMFCPTGGIQIAYICPEGRGMITLQGPEAALHVPALHWLDIRNLSSKTSLVVLASNEYDEADYIRNLADFEKLIAPLRITK